jgi:hypothetical protein
MLSMLEVPVSGFREKSVQKREQDMPAVVEARAMLCDVPLDVSRGESKGVWLARVSRLHGIAPALGRRIYYGERKTIDADTFNRMKTLNQRIAALKAEEQRHRKHVDEIKESMGVVRQRQPLDGGTS